MSFDYVDLGNGLVLHPVRNAKDASGFIALNDIVTGEGQICERLLHHHPNTALDNYTGVEDSHSGEIISTTCLIPWQLTYDSVCLNAAMLEMVVTHPDYRGRGLIRAQVKHFHKMVTENNFDFCIIQGIPYYYRQFDYAYVLDHTPVDTLPSTHVPDSQLSQHPPYRFRSARLDDVSVLTSLYRKQMRRYALTTQRDESYWRYLLKYAKYPVKVVEDTTAKRVVGYICTEKVDEQHIIVRESAFGNYEEGFVILRWLGTQISGEIRIVGSNRTPLVRIARSLGSLKVSPAQWLVHIPSFPRFLTTIGQVLESRLSHSDYGDLTSDLTLNLYREAYKLKFVGGKFCSINSLGFVDTSMGAGADGGDLWIPPEAFIRLMFGYRGLDDMVDAWPDIVVKAGTRSLWEILFPRMDNLILMPC